MSQTRSRRVEALRTVDPVELGGRIRAARLARGWTQTELAGGALSVGYVSRIENGSRRPTLRILATLAQRVSCSVDELLHGETASSHEEIRLGLAYVELALQNGEALDAEHQARVCLAKAQEASLADLVEQANFLVARTLESLGQLDEAIVAFESLLATATGLQSIRCGIALSRCYREVGDLALAVEVGERLLPRLAADGLDRTDEAVQLAMTVALAYIERGDLSRAGRICTEAIRRAEEMASPSARSAAYWNSSIVYSERGEISAALTLAERALALLGEGQDARNLARLRLELGRLQLHLDEPKVSEALEQLTRGCEELAGSSASAAELAQGHVTLAQAYLLQGQPERAADLASRARSAAAAPLARAEAAVVEGEALSALGLVEQARDAYQYAADRLAEIEGPDRWAAQVWYELAALLEELGDSEGARTALRGAAGASGLRTRSRMHARPTERLAGVGAETSLTDL